MAANVHPIRPLKAFNPAPVPDRLKGLKAWVVYILTPREGKPGKTDKRPVDANGVPLHDWNHPSKLLTFEDAIARLRELPDAAGLGLCMRGQTALTGVDLDGVIEGGTVAPWAQEIVDLLGSYTEVSPSGKGLRVFVEGETLKDWRDHSIGIEVYGGHGKQFLTVTGDRVPGTAPGVNPAPAGLSAVEARYRRPESATAADTPMPDLVQAPELESLELPAHAMAFLAEGSTGMDRSKSLQAAARALCKRYDDATALSVLVESPYAWEIALDHRRQDDEKALAYLWKHVRDARAATGSPLGPVASLFEDIAPTEAHAAPISGFEPQEFTHEGVLPVGVTLFAGGHGHGKTSLLVPMACISSGELDGARTGLPADLHRNVVYFTEDPAQARRIRYGLQKHCGLNPNGRFHVHQAQRRSAEAVAVLIAKIIAKYTLVGPNGYLVRPLIVFDTINACFGLENENDASQVGQVMSAIKTHSQGAPVWLVGHLPKSLLHKDVDELTARGSGAWEADAQCTAFIVAGEDESDSVRYLVTKKRRFETTVTEVRFETFTDSETVPTPWGTTQELGYRYGVPERPAVSRKEEKELRRDDAKTKSMMEDVETLVDFIARRVEAEGEVWMYKRGAGVSPRAPKEAEGFVLTWAELYLSTGVPRPRAPGALQDAVKARFEPFEGWGRMVLKTDGELW